MSRLGGSWSVAACAAVLIGCGGAGSSPEPDEDASAVSTDGGAPATDGGGGVDKAALPGPDAGSPDSARSDSAPATPTKLSGGKPCAAQGKTLFCEDFEGGMLDQTKWTVDTSSGSSIKVDAVKVAPGSHFALHAHPDNMPPSMSARSWATVTTTMTFPVAGASLFVRTYVYLEDVKALPERHFTVLSAKGVTPLPGNAGFPYFAVNLVPTGVSGPALRYLWYNGGNEADAISNRTPDLPAAGNWSCFEWEIRGTNEMYFALNDKDLPRFMVTKANNWTGPGTVRLQFGMEGAHNDGSHPAGFNLWIDQIAVNDHKMGCDY